MQLLIIVLVVFALGFWFSRSRAAERLVDSTRNLTRRLQRKPRPGHEKDASNNEHKTSE